MGFWNLKFFCFLCVFSHGGPLRKSREVNLEGRVCGTLHQIRKRSGYGFRRNGPVDFCVGQEELVLVHSVQPHPGREGGCAAIGLQAGDHELAG